MSKSFDEIVSNFQDPQPEWTVTINGKDYSKNIQLIEFTQSINNPLKVTIKLEGIDSTDSIPEDAEFIIGRRSGELFRGVLKEVNPNMLNTYTFKGTGYAAELEADSEQILSDEGVGDRFEGSTIKEVVDTLIDMPNSSPLPNSRSFSTSFSGNVSSTVVDDFRVKKTQIEDVNRLMGEYDVEWYTTTDSNNNPVFNVTDQISFTDSNGNPLDTITTYGGNQSAEMVEQNVNRNKGDFDGVLVRGYGDGDEQITATSGSTGKGNRVLIYTDKTILSDSQAQKRADNLASTKTVNWREIEVKPSNPNKIYGVGDELKVESKEARLDDTYRVVKSYFKIWPGEDEFESKLNLSNKPQTFIDDFKEQKNQTDSQTDYSQGNRNTINEANKDLADSNTSTSVDFFIPQRFTEDLTGNDTTAQVKLDYKVEDYKKTFDSTSSDLINSQTKVVSTNVSDFGDVANVNTEKIQRDDANETTADFTSTDVTDGGGSSIILKTDDSNSSFLVFAGSANDPSADLVGPLDAGNAPSSGAKMYYSLRIKPDETPSSPSDSFEGLHYINVQGGGGSFPDSDGVRHLTKHDSIIQDLTDGGSITISTDSNGAGNDTDSFNEPFSSAPNIATVPDVAGSIISHGTLNSDNVTFYVRNGPSDSFVEVNWIARGEIAKGYESATISGVIDIPEDTDGDQFDLQYGYDGNVDIVIDAVAELVVEDTHKHTLPNTDRGADNVTAYMADTNGNDIDAGQGSVQDTESLPDGSTTTVSELSADDIILSTQATNATSLDIIVNGTTIQTESFSGSPPYSGSDIDIPLSDLNVPGENTVELKPDDKALVKGNVIVDHKIEGERK